MTIYIRAANPIWYMVDHVGQPLNDEYYAHFLTNTLPYAPQLVYRNPTGTVVWTGGIVQFQPSGTLPNNLYFSPDNVYRIEIRRGPSQSDPLIWEINDFVPDSSSSTDNTANFPNLTNFVTNPQFFDVSFINSVTFTDAGEYNFAPGWDIVLEGSGTATLSKVILNANEPAPIPPYAIKVAASGSWTSVVLRQRFNSLGQLWNGGSVAMYCVAKSDTGAGTVTMSYAPQSPPSSGAEEVATGPIVTSTYSAISGAKILNNFNNSNANNITYIDILINIPTSGTTNISSVQMLGQSESLTDSPVIPEFQDETIERQSDYLFHYYKDGLVYKPTSNYLVGWDFPLNPCQFGGSTQAASGSANTSKYVWDQTILYQSEASGFSVSRGTCGEIVLTAEAAGQFALVQYLDGDQVREMLTDPLCFNLSAYSTAAGGTKVSIELYYTGGTVLPSMGSSNSIVLTLDSNGKIATLNQPTGGTWQIVPKLNNQSSTFIIDEKSSNGVFNDYPLNGWDLGGSSAVETAKFFAIVIGSESMEQTEEVHILSGNLSSGYNATRPNPKSKSETLRDCQYYYEKSYPFDIAPGTASNTNNILSIPVPGYDDGANLFIRIAPFSFNYLVQKRTVPSTTFYNVAGTSGNVSFYTYYGTDNPSPAPASGSNPNNGVVVATYYSAISNTNKTLSYLANNTHRDDNIMTIPTGITSAYAYKPIMYFHYVADARLGIT